MDYEFVDDYNHIEFAKTWRDMESTQEEIEDVLSDPALELGEFGVYTWTLSDYIDMQYEILEEMGTPPNILPYIDMVQWLHNLVMDSSTCIFKTKSGYFVIEEAD